MTYLLEVSTCLIVFYAMYFCFLHKKSFHAWNRYFLLGGIALSLIIPALSFPVYEATMVTQEQANNARIVAQPNTESGVSTPIDWMYVLQLLYLSVVMFLITKTVREIFNIYRIIRVSKTSREDGLVRVFVDQDLPTSSFFHYLFIPITESISHMEYEHEQAHIKQWHSLDKLLLSLLTAIFWFNPIIYLYKNRLDEIHEYLADEAVINNNTKSRYLDFLKNKIEKQYQYELINPFYSLIKNRLTMINQNAKSSRKIFLIVIPLCVFLVGMFSCDAQEIDNSTINSDVTVAPPEINEDGEYMLYADTITYFDEDTYTETVRVVKIFDTKEVYEAYQEALKTNHEVYFYDEKGEEPIWHNYMIKPVPEMINEMQYLTPDQIYSYKIMKNGKVIKTVKFSPKDFRKDE